MIHRLRAVDGRYAPWPGLPERTPMHIGFLGGGTGSARAAADYLVGERDSAGRVRRGDEVLRETGPHIAVFAA